MRALVCEGPGLAGLREIAVPEPGPGDVLVRVDLALTCATDFKILKRGHPKITFPLTLGHEFAGRVEKVGGAARFLAGERVTSAVSGPCGTCIPCRSGRENLCETAFEKPLFGAFADFLLVPARLVKGGLRRIPAGVPDEAAALLDPLASVVHAIGRVKAALGGNVLIAGSGPIAAMFLFLLREEEEREKTGAERRLVVAGRREERLVFFERNEAEVARIGTSSRKAGAGASPLFTFKENPRSFSLVIDTTGDPALIEALPALAADGGTVLLFAGLPAGARLSLDARALHYREVSVVGSFHYTPRDADDALALLSRGVIPADDLVSLRRPLDQWQDAFALALSGTAMKVGIVP